MKLYPKNRIIAVAHRHDLVLVIYRRDDQFVGQGVFGHDPTVVTPRFKNHGHILEKIGVIAQLFHQGRHAVVHAGKIVQVATKGFTNGLMTQTNAQNTLARGIFFDQFRA